MSLRRNDGVSDSSVYLIIVIRYQEENKTVHFYSKSGSPALVTREWLISLEGDMQNSVPGRGKKDLLFNFNLINRSRITKVYWQIVLDWQQTQTYSSNWRIENLKKSIQTNKESNFRRVCVFSLNLCSTLDLTFTTVLRTTELKLISESP